MSHQASVTVLAAIRAGKLPDGAQGLVLLAMAVEADHTQGHRVAESTRQLPGHHVTVRAAQRAGVAAGVLQLIHAPSGTRAPVFRVVVPSCGQPPDSALPSDALEDDDRPASASHARYPARASASLSSASLDRSLDKHLRAVTTPGDPDPIALVVGTEMAVARARGPLRDPSALADTIRARVSTAHGALLRGVADLDPRQAALAVLRVDMRPCPCPLTHCGAVTARAITDPNGCSLRHERCPFYVAETTAGDAGRVERGPSPNPYVGNQDMRVPASPARVAAP